ncbi:SOS response-associated peptidase [Microvirga sp. GCM10011540]|uniref:SOS response-associated peptidase n=1 Tax=Microvirga sp. GCM10011540 TaxID=3317338 RepID=UPI00361B1F8B
MCNLYSSYTTQQALRETFQIAEDRAGNIPPLPAIFPDQMAPVVRNSDAGRELIQMRWGFPPPPKVGNHPVTNVRNVGSPFWRAWLKPEHRCLVPVTSFSEYADTQPRKTPVWFAQSEDRPLMAFAGIWRPWKGVRGTKADPVEGEHLLYSFLTCDPNEIVKPIHPKAMPVILTTPEEYEIWLNAPTEEALKLQRQLPDDMLEIVAEGQRSDKPEAA